MPTRLMPLHVSTPILQNEVVAIPACEVKVLSSAFLLEESPNLGGPWTTMSGTLTAPGKWTNGGHFVRSPSGATNLYLTRIKMKELP